MAYCPRCGTANPGGSPQCPLCATTLPVFDDETATPSAWASPSEDETARVWLTAPQKRRRALFTVSFFLLFPVGVVSGVDLLLAGAITWSWIPDLVLISLWLLIAGVFLGYQRPLALLPYTAVLASSVLLLTNVLSSGKLDWSLTAGLPLVAWTWLLATGLVLWLRRARMPGWNLFGHLCWGAAALCGGTELILRVSALVGPGFWWSAVVGLVLVPLGLFFEVLHYGLGRRLNLRQSFHF